MCLSLCVHGVRIRYTRERPQIGVMIKTLEQENAPRWMPGPDYKTVIDLTLLTMQISV